MPALPWPAANLAVTSFTGPIKYAMALPVNGPGNICDPDIPGPYGLQAVKKISSKRGYF